MKTTHDMEAFATNALESLSKGQPHFINFLRVAIFVVMAWIGGLKVCQYEADGIVPFVANSPAMNFFYAKEAPEYQAYRNPEGLMVEKNIRWHEQNRTYLFSYGLGAVIVFIGAMVLLGIWSPHAGLLGGLLTFGMAIVTLSFLITTPETWVPNLGGDRPTPHYGFPYLSAAGRLVIKDIIMMAGGLVVASDSARSLLLRWRRQQES